jgi:hypothetical protein
MFATLQKGGPGEPLLWRGSEKGREHGLGRSGGSAIRRLKGNGDWQFTASEGMIFVAMKPSSLWFLTAWKKACWLLHGGGCWGVLKIVVSKA